MHDCEVCGEALSVENKATTHCPECDRMRCEFCDMGAGSLCIDCDCD